MSFIILVVKCINTEFLQKTLITDITYFTHGSCNLKALTRTEGRKTLMGEGGGGTGVYLQICMHYLKRNSSGKT